MEPQGIESAIEAFSNKSLLRCNIKYPKRDSVPE
jgi:hypothetical protein